MNNTGNKLTNVLWNNIWWVVVRDAEFNSSKWFNYYTVNVYKGEYIIYNKFFHPQNKTWTYVKYILKDYVPWEKFYFVASPTERFIFMEWGGKKWTLDCSGELYREWPVHIMINEDGAAFVFDNCHGGRQRTHIWYPS